MNTSEDIELAEELWRIYYTYDAKLHGKASRGRGTGLHDCRHADKFFKAAEMCRKSGMAAEEYVRGVLECAARTGRVLTPACLTDKSYAYIVKPRAIGDYMQQLAYQMQYLEDWTARYMADHPGADLDTVLQGLLVMGDAPFRPWFRILALDAPFDRVLELYGGLAVSEMRLHPTLREFLEQNTGRALGILDNWAAGKGL